MNLFEGTVLALQLGSTVHAVWSHSWWRALYWGGAFLLTLAVVKGMRT